MKNKKSIGFLMGKASETGGISRVTSILTGALAKTGLFDIHIFSYHPSNLKSGFHWSPTISFHDLLSEEKSMYSGILKATTLLRAKIKSLDINTLIICGFNMGLLGVLATRLKRIGLIYWSHSSFFGYKVPFKNFNEQVACYFSDIIVTLTKADLHTYQKKTFAKKVVQLYNPIDESLFLTNKEYNPDTKKILSVGRLDESKNFHSFTLDVAKKVLKKFPEYTWHIYGSGDFDEVIAQEIKFHNLEHNVILEGHAENIYELYQNHSILVMTSSFEGFPMILLEGMAKGLPLVSFDVPTGPNEIIKESKNGYLITAFDCNEMALKIIDLIEHREKRISFSRTNTTLLEEFSSAKIAKKWTELLVDKEI